MSKKQTLSLVILLAVCWWAPLTVSGQTHEWKVGEFNSFGVFSWIRLSTDVIFDPVEARTADVRCFHEFNDLDAEQRAEALQEISSRQMHLASRLDNRYYVVEVDPVVWIANNHAATEQSTEVLLPATWDVSNDGVPRLEHAIRTADTLVAAPTSSDVMSNLHLHDDTYGVVSRHPGEFGELPCNRIVNWSGTTEIVGHSIAPTAGSAAQPGNESPNGNEPLGGAPENR